MANYRGYQEPQYITGYVSPNFEAIQKNIDYRQEMYDKTMMQFGNAQAVLNEEPTISPDTMRKASENFASGFDELFARTGGDFATHHGDAYQYIMNAKKDSVYNLNKLQFDSYKRAEAEKAKGNVLVFKDVDRNLITKDGRYNDPSAFDFQIEDHKDWGGKRAEIANHAMQASSYDSKLGLSTEAAGMYERTKYSGRSLNQIPGKADAMLKTYLDTPEGSQEKRWYMHKGLSEEKAEDKIRGLLTGSAKLFEAKSSDVQNMGIPGWTTNTPEYNENPESMTIPAIPVESSPEYKFNLKKGVSSLEGYTDLIKAGTQALHNTVDPILMLYNPEKYSMYLAGTNDSNYKAVGDNAYNSSLNELLDKYRSKGSAARKEIYDVISDPKLGNKRYLYEYSHFTKVMGEALKLKDRQGRIKYYNENASKIMPGKLSTDSRALAIKPALTADGIPDDKVNKQIAELYDNVLSTSAISSGIFKGYGTYAEGAGPITYIDNSTPKRTNDLITVNGKTYSNIKRETMSITLSDSPQDKASNGSGTYVQSVIVSFQASDPNDVKDIKTFTLRVPVDQFENNKTIEALLNTDANKINIGYNTPLRESNITSFDMSQTDPLLNSQLIQAFKFVNPDKSLDKATKIMVNYGKINSSSDDEVHLTDATGKIIYRKFNGSEFLDKATRHMGSVREAIYRKERKIIEERTKKPQYK